MKRPQHWKRLHFSCDGTIVLTRAIPPGFAATGDTASAADEDDTAMHLWRCAVIEGTTAWTIVEAWTQDAAKRFVSDADVLVVVAASGLCQVVG